LIKISPFKSLLFYFSPFYKGLPLFIILSFLLSCVSLTPVLARSFPEPKLEKISDFYAKRLLYPKISGWRQQSLHGSYKVFEPELPDSVKNNSGIVLILHDALSPAPEHYAGFIRYLTATGWIVVFPFYSAPASTKGEHLYSAVWALKDFLQQYADLKKAPPPVDKFAVWGHGTGALLAANLSASYDYFGLPHPKALLLMTPKKSFGKLLDLTGISRETFMVVVVGDKMKRADIHFAAEMFHGTDRVPRANKLFVTVRSDMHGRPPLIADYSAPLSSVTRPSSPLFRTSEAEWILAFNRDFRSGYVHASPLTLYDFLVTFRIFDNLTSAALEERQGLKELLYSKEFSSMGYWTDGKRINPMKVTANP